MTEIVRNWTNPEDGIVAGIVHYAVQLDVNDPTHSPLHHKEEVEAERVRQQLKRENIQTETPQYQQ